MGINNKNVNINRIYKKEYIVTDLEELKNNEKTLMDLINSSFNMNQYPNYAPWVLKTIEKDINTKGNMFYKKGVLVGFYRTHSKPKGDFLELYDFCIDETKRGNGYGKDMAKEMLKKVKEDGYKGLFFEENLKQDFWMTVPECKKIQSVQGNNVWVITDEDLKNKMFNSEKNRIAYNIFVDDLREVPENYIVHRTIDGVIDALKTGDIESLSLDHDLGDDTPSGYDLVKEMIMEDAWPNETINIHSANPVGVENMYQTLKRYAPAYIDINIVDYINHYTKKG